MCEDVDTEIEMTLLNLARDHLCTIVGILESKTLNVLADEYYQSTTVLAALLELGHRDDSGLGSGALFRMHWLEKEYALVMRAAEAGEPIIKRDRSKLH